MKHTVTRFPDGQITAVIEEGPLEPVRLRINSYADLFEAKSIIEATHNLYKDAQVSLFIPCLFGQRSDRRFKENESFALKIICDFINSMGYSEVQIFDPHSDVSLALINGAKKVSSFDYVKQAVDLIASDNLIFVPPDAGAYKKVFGYAEATGKPCVGANKFRSLDGKIELVFTGDVAGKDCLIVDDLADGGRTFVELAKKLKEQGAARVFLYVSHGYFSQGFTLLQEVIDHIYCTNSVKDLEPNDFITQFKII